MTNDEAVERVKAFLDLGIIAGSDADAAIRHLLSRYERMEKALEWYGDQFCEHGPYSKVCGLCGPDDCAGCPARQAPGASEVGAPHV